MIHHLKIDVNKLWGIFLKKTRKKSIFLRIFSKIGKCVNKHRFITYRKDMIKSGAYFYLGKKKYFFLAERLCCIYAKNVTE